MSNPDVSAVVYAPTRRSVGCSSAIIGAVGLVFIAFGFVMDDAIGIAFAAFGGLSVLVALWQLRYGMSYQRVTLGATSVCVETRGKRADVPYADIERVSDDEGDVVLHTREGRVCIYAIVASSKDHGELQRELESRRQAHAGAGQSGGRST